MPANPGLAAQIDALLTKRGSPMAGMGHVFVAAGNKYGVDPRLVVSISGIESSFGTRIFGAHNAWGWGPGRPFGSWEEGISTVTQGLYNGYISQGLTTPSQIVSKYAPGSDGNNEQNWANTVSGFIKDLGGRPTSMQTVTPQTTAPPPPTSGVPSVPSSAPVVPIEPSHDFMRQAAFSVLGGIAKTGHVNALDMLGQFSQGISTDRQVDAAAARALASVKPAGPTGPTGPTTPPPATTTPDTAPAAPISSTWLKQGAKVIGTPYAGTHTIGNWQSDNAIDIAVPTGTPIYAPVAGQLGNTGLLPGAGASGGGRFAGERINLYGGGQGFYFAHLSQLAAGIRQGATVKKGQLLGYTGEANGVQHLHFGVEHGSPYTYYGR